MPISRSTRRLKSGLASCERRGSSKSKVPPLQKSPGASTDADEAALKNPSAADPKTKELIKRGILQESETVRYAIAITPEGLALAKKGLDLREETGTLTRDQIISGEWKTANLRKYDVTKLPKKAYPGKIHPYQRIIAEMREILLEMGFTELYGGIVQQSFWNFDALFQPQDHPAREMQDTFYLRETLPLPKGYEKVKAMHVSGGETSSTGWGGVWKEEKAEQCVLRTHTTSVSIQYLAKNPNPPVKAFCVGRVYRRETIDTTHLAEFEQLEGIVMDENVSFGNLLGILREFYNRMGFESVRFKPSFYPYTEPSLDAEVYVDGIGWIEMGGAGVFREEVTAPHRDQLPRPCLGSWREPDRDAPPRPQGSPATCTRATWRSSARRLRCARRREGSEMAVITLPYKYLERLTRTDRKTILDKVALIGSDVERIEEDHADVEFFPDRPDLFSPEGVARAMRGYLGIETGLPYYPVKPSGISFTIDPHLRTSAPCSGQRSSAGSRSMTSRSRASCPCRSRSTGQSAGAGARLRSASMIWTRSNRRSTTSPRPGAGGSSLSTSPRR